MIVSIDIETTGLDPTTHQPISIGAVIIESNGQYNEFYWQLEWNELVVTPEAMNINGLNIVNPPGLKGDRYNRSVPLLIGLKYFSNFLRRLATKTGAKNTIALGKNVGSFDLPFLKNVWDRYESDLGKWPFSYRSIDLNSLMFAIAELHNRDFSEVQSQIKQAAWDKIREKVVIPRHIGEHHALADAWWNIYAWRECLKCFSRNTTSSVITTLDYHDVPTRGLEE